MPRGFEERDEVFDEAIGSHTPVVLLILGLMGKVLPG
jgi:hypothetical protein